MAKKLSIQVPIYMALIILKPSRHLGHTCYDLVIRLNTVPNNLHPRSVEQGARVEFKDSSVRDSLDTIYDPGSLQDISAD